MLGLIGGRSIAGFWFFGVRRLDAEPRREVLRGVPGRLPPFPIPGRPPGSLTLGDMVTTGNPTNLVRLGGLRNPPSSPITVEADPMSFKGLLSVGLCGGWPCGKSPCSGCD